MASGLRRALEGFEIWRRRLGRRSAEAAPRVAKIAVKMAGTEAEPPTRAEIWKQASEMAKRGGWSDDLVSDAHGFPARFWRR